MDVVSQAGISVEAWFHKQDGARVAKPKANPRYCYEWAFGGGPEPIALFVWDESLRILGGRIVSEGRFKLRAELLEQIAADETRSTEDRNRSAEQAGRAREFDRRVHEAYEEGRSVRVVLLRGRRRADEQLGTYASTVKKRGLDEEPWFVRRYDDADGAYTLVRGATNLDLSAAPDFVDQFSVPDPRNAREVLAQQYPRSAQVRADVLLRAAGRCEACGAEGFTTASGAKYLETHHVLALAEGGPDTVWNVIALCPNDHRRAHYGTERQTTREDFGLVMNRRYPGVLTRLRSLERWAEGLPA